MAVTVQKAPFVSDFGGFYIQEHGDWLYCTEKNVKIHKDLLIAAVQAINKVPHGQKFLVGKQILGEEKAEMWRDDFTTYIGCLDEPTREFNKKYQRLIKHLNTK
jgi:hypothetical protein